jgi:hypothetical protein
MQEKDSENAETKIHRRRPQKEKLIDANSSRKSFSQPEHGCYQALEQEIEFVCSKRKTEVLACEVIKYKST